MPELPLIRPMLAVSSKPFDSQSFLYEIKWDGYRGLAYLDRKTVIRSRNLIDLSDRFPELARLHEKVDRLPAVLDGEIVVFEKGRPSFKDLQARGRMIGIGEIAAAALERPAVFVAFDVLYLGGKNVMKLPLGERKGLLADVAGYGDSLEVPEFVVGCGRDFFQACVKKGLEGIVAKKIQSVYLPGRRSQYWKKIRHTREADLVVCGYQLSRRGGNLGSLVLGGYRNGKLVYQGKVGTGFGVEEAAGLMSALRKIETYGSELELPGRERRLTKFVVPMLVCGVEYTSETADGLLRHPVYKGLRWDKSPVDCEAVETKR
ncbi:MAG TPA: non-homologous end-joining DNA ligase [Bacillota bacterium]|nr:non-homologous end-joining DNA ligase [Bacillota bacterium]